ncbi:MAG TPA: hypothetical protein V6D26_30820 [Stenomitos sp.]
MIKTACLTGFSALIFCTAISLAQDTQKFPTDNIIQNSSDPDDDSKELIGKGINLVSFTVGQFQDSKQSLEVPNASPGNPPKVVVQHPNSGYRWSVKNLQLNNIKDFFQAQAPDNKIKALNDLKIEPSQLFAKAEISDSSPISIPVILNRSTSQYEFVFYCDQCTASINNAKIIASDGQKNCSLSPNPTVTRVFCNSQQLKKGRFRLSISGNLKMSGSRDSEPLSNSYNFRHNPEWLK